MAIWGIGILLGPIMGPTVGGFITDHLDWRWVFYINLPIGIINLLLLAAFLTEDAAHRRTADWTGALLLATRRRRTADAARSRQYRGLAAIELHCRPDIVSIVCIIAFIIRSVPKSECDPARSTC